MKRKKSINVFLKSLGVFVLTMVVALSFVSVTRSYADDSAADTALSGADTASVTEIYDYNDLLKISDNPSGSYKLMADIDLAGVMWTPLVFSGTFDGNGYAVLNTTVAQVTSQTRKTYDGNMIDYDTCFAGFFGILENATVTNLKLLGIKVNITTQQPTFIGAITGFMENSSITGCTIEGELQLYTTGHSFGVAGIAGFGNGKIEDTSANVTLVCADQDTEYKDEQFMGGAYCSGYIDLNNDVVNIDGYDSDHGYVHNGGLVGMYILYPSDNGYQGYITNNTVTGMITFFEDNEDRRAYCEPICGEIMNWTFNMDGNNGDGFVPNEVFEYDQVLLPHNCTSPAYTDTVTASDCTNYGYTTHKCTACDYSYKSDYTPLAHNVTAWNTTKQATESSNAVEQGACSLCGKTVYRTASAPDVTETETTTEAKTKEEKSSGNTALIIIIIVVVAAAAVVIALTLAKKAKIKKQKEAKRRAAMARRARAGENVYNPSGRPRQSTGYNSSQRRQASSRYNGSAGRNTEENRYNSNGRRQDNSGRW